MKVRIFAIVSIIAVLVLLLGGLAEPVSALSTPTVETRPATSITATGAILNGRIVNDGGSSILERRFDWGTTPSGAGWTNWTANVSVSGNYFSYYLTGLNPGTTYYFRAWAKNSAGWSQGTILSFTTLLSPPTLVSPGNGAVNVSTRPTFQWTSVSGASGYWLLVATSPSNLPTDPYATSCPGCVFEAYTSSISYTPSSPLQEGTIYYWKVQPCNSSVTPIRQGEYSATWSFKTGTSQASARIESYYPNTPVEVIVGDSTIIGVTFTNTGSNAWNFIAGATVWDSNGNQVNNYTKSVFLQPNQSTTVNWSHKVNQAGDYWIQFGIWKATPFTSENLLDKKPVPAQKLIIGKNPSGLPDLIVEAIWTEPDPPVASDYTNIGIKIKNQGNSNATRTFFLEFYFDGIYKGHVYVDGLTAGSSKTFYWNAEIWPSDTNPHTIKGVVDPDNTIIESNEGNNELSKQFTATKPPPSTGTLWIESVPGNAEVYVDGEYKGKTPSSGYLTISNLTAGDHNLRVTKSGYKEWIGVVTIPPGKIAVEAVILEPLTTNAPTLYSIDNPDCNGDYAVSWSSVSGATRYELDEDDNSSFSSPTRVYSGSATSWSASGKSPGTYYYRVRACSVAGCSNWSSSQSVRVWPIPSAPTLYSISNPDGDGNYTVSWSSVSDATSYTLQEDDNPLFSSPTTVYSGPSTSNDISGRGAGTYYYRVRASNCRGDSGWSNIQSVIITKKDDIPPQVDAFSVSPNLVIQGDTVTISYTVSDTGGSGLNRVELWRAIEFYGPQNWTEIARASISGDKYSGFFSDAPPLQSSWEIIYWYGLHVMDNAGNWNDERNSATGGSPGVYGPIRVLVKRPSLPDLEIDQIQYQPIPIEFQPFDLILHVSNKGETPYKPGSGHYIVKVIVNERLGVIPGKYWSFVFDSKRAYESKYMTPARLPEVGPGQSLEIRLKDLHLPRIIWPSELKVTLIPENEDINPLNDTFVDTEFGVDPDPSAKDCIWVTAKMFIMVMFSTARKVTESLTDTKIRESIVEDFTLSFLKYSRAIDECHEYHCVKNATKDLLKDFKDMIFKYITPSPMKWLTNLLTGFLEELTQTALDLGECFLYIWNLITDLISSLTAEGIPLNAVFVASPANVLIMNSSGQRVGFLDDGTIVQEIEGAQVLNQNGMKFVFYPGSDTELIRVRGTAMGTFDLNLILSVGEGCIAKVEYLDIPVSTDTVGIVSAQDKNYIMYIDNNGDNVIDFTQSPDKLSIIRSYIVHLPIILKNR
jgi:hypothetical protein